ncbi:popeye domain-containing protein 2 isoform X1 [Alligator sinensis]|uniref:Popeye domain-containing protein 2 isoform X1 n=1 Tax=Alligator sinensis TaxID=38654 RepID=A0A1U7SF45_ALLSI|nr:popeye domain-containing protein 2 isoform X1 [Alligator sinensis]
MAGAGRDWERMSRNSTFWDQIFSQPLSCEVWKQNMEEAAYHLAGCILLLGYMGGSGIFGSIYIFSLLAIGYFCYALWGWLDACGLDIFIWNMLLVMACLLQLAHLTYLLRKDTFLEEFDLLYKTIYQPLQVPLQVYKEIVKCCEEQVLSLTRDQSYALEGKTPINRLSLLLSGRVRVSQDGQFLHYIFPYQFMDSPEWESLRPSEEGIFQVTLTAETDCSYVSWPRKRLYFLLRKDRYIARLFSSHLGCDISEKLYALNDKLFAKFGLRFDIRLPSLYHVLGPASSELEKELEECDEPPAPPRPLPTFVQTAASAPPPPPPSAPASAPPAHPKAGRPDSDLLGEDSTSLVLEDFAELPGSFMDYVSEGEYMK